MKIVDEAYTPSKKECMKKILYAIAGRSDKAASFSSENEFREFCKLARACGFKPKSRKQTQGGWKVWVVQ
jgi:hypothetical protein